MPHGVRISAGSVPVKDRYRKKGREKSKISRGSADGKNAASDGALRRIEQESGRFVAKRLRSELGRILRWRVGRRAVSVEPLACGFGYPVA